MVSFTYFTFALALVASSFAAPAPGVLEKRITHNGRGTFFNVGLGACGKVNKNTDLIVAIASSRFKFVEVVNKKTGLHAFGLVRDSCPGCKDGDLDMSPALFKAVGASLEQGVIDIEWHFMKKGFRPF
ncbi:RlpA-like double-psi beta-barrel-protein domain-containing protein-containing protein [Earliella scabrosa]|nr:RlpA-like double-psi beta-barrel-protein domain-containing protein-containing protein [Earliella scabrosa]